MERLISLGDKCYKGLVASRYVGERWPRVISGPSREHYTFGVVFGERIRNQNEALKNHICLEKTCFTSTEALLVLKKENMLGDKLDSSRRIPWGVMSKPFGQNSTARSYRTVIGLFSRARMNE